MIAAPAIRIAALSAALTLPLALLAATPAAAATVSVVDQVGLQNAFLVGGDTVVLSGNITFPAGQSLSVDTGESIILDLNGFTLTITEPADTNPAIWVPATSSLTINATGGGTITATGANFAAGIGGGYGLDGGGGGATTINGGTITATGGVRAAGIGGGRNGDGGTTTINGGTITATGGTSGAGIGGGLDGSGGTTTINGGTTTINRGTITATGGNSGAGIGGGDGDGGGTTTINGGTITINGGTTTATGGFDAAGIGGGNGGNAGVLNVNGTPVVGAATNGGNPTSGSNASPITNPVQPAGVGYSATTSTVGGGGRIELLFNYLVTFTSNGGSTTANQTTDYDGTVTEPAAPTREGFTFAGWNVEGVPYDFDIPVTGPITLTATWTAAPEDTVPDSGSPGSELAATGADVNPALGVATLLLAGGITLIALRRRAATRST